LSTKDVVVEVPISRRESLEGCHRLVRIRRQRLIDGRLREYRETLRTEIPPLEKLEDSTFRLRGKGHEALDGTSGDAVLQVVVGRVQAMATAPSRVSSIGVRVLAGALSLATGAVLPFVERLPIVVHALVDTALGFLLIGVGISLLWDAVRRL
jgi:hypothetical protein